MEILTIIIQYLPLAISIVLSVFYFNANKRIKNNEAEKGEIENLTKIINEIRKEKDSLKLRVEVLEEKEVINRQEMLKREMKIVDYEGILIKIKSAMNFGLGCQNKDKCPIIKKYNEINTNLV